MKSLQYTIRGVHPVVDRKLREHARRSHRSINAATLDALRRGLAINESELNKPVDRLAGLRAFDQAAKNPSPFNKNKSVKELYRESITKKYST